MLQYRRKLKYRKEKYIKSIILKSIYSSRFKNTSNERFFFVYECANKRNYGPPDDKRLPQPIEPTTPEACCHYRELVWPLYSPQKQNYLGAVLVSCNFL